MCKYQRVNLICGFISFLISAVIYILTVEPSASFWDCPEFILSASRLEVGHPPGVWRCCREMMPIMIYILLL